MNLPCIYIITNQANRTLYTGATDDLPRRIYHYKSKLIEGFAKTHCLDKLVWHQSAHNMAVAEEMKNLVNQRSRESKIELIKNLNPLWKDLYEDIIK